MSTFGNFGPIFGEIARGFGVIFERSEKFFGVTSERFRTKKSQKSFQM